MSGNNPHQDTPLETNAEVTRDPVSPSFAERPPSKRSVRLWLLFVTHVILGPLFCIWWTVEGILPIGLLQVLVFAIILAQSSLLGFWTIFSKVKWWMRLPGLIIGAAYLEALLYIGTQSEDISWLVVLSTVGITVVFGLARWLYADLRHFSQHAPAANQEGLRFSIRGLMFCTFGVAVTIVGAKVLRESTRGGPNLFVATILSLCFVVVGLAGVWAGLGLARPTLRIVVVLLTAVIVGILLVYTLNGVGWEMYFYTISTMVLQALVLIASLLIVRSCGYRLVRKSTPEAEPLD